jgi:hypothetical protein
LMTDMLGKFRRYRPGELPLHRQPRHAPIEHQVSLLLSQATCQFDYFTSRQLFGGLLFHWR